MKLHDTYKILWCDSDIYKVLNRCQFPSLLYQSGAGRRKQKNSPPNGSNKETSDGAAQRHGWG